MTTTTRTTFVAIGNPFVGPVIIAAAQRPQKLWKSRTVSARRGGIWGGGLPRPQFCESGGVASGKFFENIGANLCSLVHFGNIRSSKVGRKIDAFPSHFWKWDGNYCPCRIGSAAPATSAATTTTTVSAVVSLWPSYSRSAQKWTL